MGVRTTFLMGSHGFYPEERSVRRVSVDGFWMDKHPVTNAQFRRFVKATSYVTVAGRPLDSADYADASPSLLVRQVLAASVRRSMEEVEVPYG